MCNNLDHTMTLNFVLITEFIVKRKSVLCTVCTNYNIIDENNSYRHDEGITDNCFMLTNRYQPR